MRVQEKADTSRYIWLNRSTFLNRRPRTRRRCDVTSNAHVYDFSDFEIFRRRHVVDDDVTAPP